MKSGFLLRLRRWFWFAATSVVVVIGAYFTGRRAADKTQAVKKMNALNQASKQVRHVKEEIDSLDDASLRERSKRWVRNK